MKKEGGGATARDRSQAKMEDSRPNGIEARGSGGVGAKSMAEDECSASIFVLHYYIARRSATMVTIANIHMVLPDCNAPAPLMIGSSQLAPVNPVAQIQSD